MKSKIDLLSQALESDQRSLTWLANQTRLTIPEILSLDTAPVNLIAYRAGIRAVQLHIVLEGARPWQKIAKLGWRYDLNAYWRGVLDAINEEQD